MNPNLKFTAVDSRVRRPVLPARILWTEGSVENPDILLTNDIGQALVQPSPCCRIQGPASILIDFGAELHGQLQLVTGPMKNKDGQRYIAKFRLRFGESVSEAMGEPNNDHAMHDTVIEVPTWASQTYGMTGFRFARLDLLNEVSVPLVACRAISVTRDLEQIGQFRCNDDRLNQIWQVGVDTVHLCLQDFIWDGIKRDRAVWVGDLHPEVSVIAAAWGALDIVPQSLDWIRDSSPLPAWMNNISSYSMWWFIIQRDWYLQTGDLANLQHQRAYLTGLLPVLAAEIQPDGSLQGRGWQFLDWPSSKNPAAIQAGLIALLSQALLVGAELCGLLNETTVAQQARTAADSLLAPALPLESKQASALLALSGFYDAHEVNEKVLARNPLSGLSTFYGFYVLQARAAAGDVTQCLDIIRAYWGAMLDLGATTFWEDFDLSWLEDAGRIDELPEPGKRDVHFERGDYCYKSWRHSLCHGWAAGPTAWLSQWVLGIEVLEPGAKKVRVRPHLGDLEWAEGTYPTIHGPIHVRHERKPNGEVLSTISAPEGVEIVRE